MEKRMQQKMLGYLYLTLAMITVGSTVIASKIIAAGLPPFTATGLRFALALPFFIVIMRVTGQKLPKLSRRDWTILALEAGAGSVGYTTFLIGGMNLTSATDAAVIIGTLPVVSAIIAIVFLGERPGRLLIAAILLGTGGVLIVTLKPGAAFGHSTAGNALILCAVLCEGLFILINKTLHTRIPPLAQSTLMTALGLAICLIPAGLEQGWTQPFSQSAFLSVAYYAIVPTVGGFLWWFAGSARVSGVEASLFTGLAPVTAFLLAIVILGEPASWLQAAGVACVLAAIGLIALAQKRP
jgi:drug/metabolite transporter (DMT)-like permease